MGNRKVIYCRTWHIVGRWNSKENRCEYLIDNDYDRWSNDINKSTQVNAVPCNRKMKQWSQPHNPAFLCKAFVRQDTTSWGRHAKREITPTKLNHWQKMEGMMQI